MSLGFEDAGGTARAPLANDDIEDLAVRCMLILEAGKEMEVSGGVGKGDFLRAVSVAKDSLDTRYEMANSPRGDLDFLGEFLK